MTKGNQFSCIVKPVQLDEDILAAVKKTKVIEKNSNMIYNAMGNQSVMSLVNNAPFGLPRILAAPTNRLTTISLSTLPIGNQFLEVNDSTFEWTAGFLPPFGGYQVGLTAGQLGKNLTYCFVADTGHVKDP